MTEIEAISPLDSELRTFSGPTVPGITEADAQDYCENNELGFCKVIGELIAEIPCKEGTYEPDVDRMIDYQIPSMN